MQTDTPSSPTDPLEAAYQTLQGDDPTVQKLRKHVWRRMHLRNYVRDHLAQGGIEPAVLGEIPLALPGDDDELLRDVHSIVAERRDSPLALYILGLINERLNRSKSALAQPTRWRPAEGEGPVEQYEGFVCASLRLQRGRGEAESVSERDVLPRTRYILTTQIRPVPLHATWEDGFAFTMPAGTDFLELELELDSATVPYSYGRRKVRFHRSAVSSEVGFELCTPATAGGHALFVHVFRERRLLKSLLVTLNIASWKTSASKLPSSRTRAR